MNNAIESANSEINDSIINLDDHRLQPSSLPRAESSGHRTRRGTFASSHHEVLEETSSDAIPVIDTAARESEQAIIEDSASAMDEHTGRRGVATTKETSRRLKSNYVPSTAACSSRSSSPSPPTSLHAFAERSRRRGRPVTVENDDASIGVAARRSFSESVAARRRATITSVQDLNEKDDVDSVDGSVEDDVCYPQDDVRSIENAIDFEELHEFVEEAEQLVVPASGRHVYSAAPGSIADFPIDPMPSHTQPLPAINAVDSAFDELEKSDITPHPSESQVTNTGAYNPLKPSYWTFFSSDIEDAIKSTTIGGLLSDEDTFQDLFAVNPDGGCWWLDVLNPNPQAVSALAKAFGMHPLTREDIVEQESREKVELFKNYYFVSFRSFEQDEKSEDYLEPVSVYAAVFRHGLITFSYSPNPHLSSVLKRIGNLRDYMQVSSDWICYAMIDNIVDTFMPTITDIEREVDSIEDQVYTARYEDAGPILRSIGESRKKVMVLLRLLGTKSDVIKGFAKRCNEEHSIAPRGDVGLYLSDIQDHIVTMRDNLAHSEQILSRVHSNFLAQINIDNINQGNKNNRLLGKVTLIATILVPMNLLTGLFGMNVHVPGKDAPGLNWFFGIVGIVLCFSITTLVVFKKLKLI